MIRVFNDCEALCQGAAEMFVELAKQAILSNGRFNVVLSGERTPHRMYEILTAEPFRKKVRWDAVQVFWSDERYGSERFPIFDLILQELSEDAGTAAPLPYPPVLDERDHWAEDGYVA